MVVSSGDSVVGKQLPNPIRDVQPSQPLQSTIDHPNVKEYDRLGNPPNKEECQVFESHPTNNERQKFVDPPTHEDVGMSRFGHHHVALIIIVITIIVVGAGAVWLNLSEESLYYTKNMLCGDYNGGVCEERIGKEFTAGETIYYVVQVIPSKEQTINLTFVADLIMPSGEMIKNFKEYDLQITTKEKEIPYSNLYLSTDSETMKGEYKLIIYMEDQLTEEKNTFEETFKLK